MLEEKKSLRRRNLLKIGIIGGAGAVGVAALAGCGETQVVEVIKEVPVEKVKEVIKEVAVVQEKIVTKIVEVEKAQRETQRMVFLHFFTGALWSELFEPMVDDFKSKNPWIDWFGISSPYGELPAKLVTMAAGGQPPDGTSIDNERIKEMSRRGLLEPLDSWVARSGMTYMDDFIPARLDQQKLEGKLYALPIDLGSGAIYLNKELFAANGVPLPEPEWTYDDILETAMKLTFDKTGNNVASSQFDENNTDTFGYSFRPQLYRFYHQYHGFGGAEFFDKDFTESRVNEPEGIAAMQYFADMIHKHHVATRPADTEALRTGGVQPMSTGKIAMEHTWIGLNLHLHLEGSKVKDYDVINLPTTPNTTVEVGGQGFVMLESGKAKEAAWEWTKYAVEEEAQKRMGANGGWFPTRLSFAHFAQPADGIPEHFNAAFYEQSAKYGFVPWWFEAGWAEIRDSMQAELDPLWIGQKSAEEVAIEMQKVGDPLIAQRPKTF